MLWTPGRAGISFYLVTGSIRDEDVTCLAAQMERRSRTDELSAETRDVIPGYLAGLRNRVAASSISDRFANAGIPSPDMAQPPWREAADSEKLLIKPLLETAPASSFPSC